MWRLKLILLEDEVCSARSGNLIRGKEVCLLFPHGFADRMGKLAHDNQAA
jgi:hypothetical protein